MRNRETEKGCPLLLSLSLPAFQGQGRLQLDQQWRRPNFVLWLKFFNIDSPSRPWIYCQFDDRRCAKPLLLSRASTNWKKASWESKSFPWSACSTFEQLSRRKKNTSWRTEKLLIFRTTTLYWNGHPLHHDNRPGRFLSRTTVYGARSRIRVIRRRTLMVSGGETTGEPEMMKWRAYK